MPTAKNLAGMQLGNLTIVSEGQRFGRERGWYAQCSCGRRELFPQGKLTKKNRSDCCSACRTIACSNCGGPVSVVQGLRRTCSELCRQAVRQAQQRESATKRRSDPDYRAALNAARRQTRADPVKGKKIREADRLSRTERMMNEKKQMLDKKNKNAWYERNRDTILRNRRHSRQSRSAEDIIETSERDSLYHVRWKVKRGQAPERKICQSRRTAAAVQTRSQEALIELLNEARNLLDYAPLVE